MNTQNRFLARSRALSMALMMLAVLLPATALHAQSLAITSSMDGYAALSIDALEQLNSGDTVRFVAPSLTKAAPAIELRLKYARQLGTARKVWNFTDAGKGNAHAVFVARNGILAGAVHTTGATWWRLISATNDVVRVEPIDQAKLPTCGGVAANPDAGDGASGVGQGGLAEQVGICSNSCLSSTVDVAMFYTQNARVGAGSTGAIEALCELAVMQANTAFENSESNTRVRIVYLGEVLYDDAVEENHLGHLSDANDGHLDEVQDIMSAVGADTASLVVEDGEGYCGVAYLFAPYHVNVRYCMGGYVFAHEFGHNLGACHACGDGGGCGCGGYFSYSVGWRWFGDSGQQWRTVMAYSPGQRIPFFSTPLIEHDGYPVGVPIGEAGEADNVSTFEYTTPLIASAACANATIRTVKLLPADPGQLDIFGVSCAAGGGRIFLGASLADHLAPNSGAAYIFSPASPGGCPPDPYGLTTGICWEETGKAPPLFTEADDAFGASLDADDNWLFVGAPLRDIYGVDKDGNEVIDVTRCGSVFVYKRSGDQFCLTEELFSDDAADDDRFGSAVALHSGRLAIGIPRMDIDGDTYAGGVEMYSRSGNTWQFESRIEGDPDDLDASARLGESLDLTGEWLAVGAPYAMSSRGVVRLYQRIAGNWTFMQQLEGPEFSNGRFGASVGISNTTLLVGAPDVDGQDGRVYAYEYDGASWELDREFLPLGGESDSQFGAAVSVDGDYAVIGAPRSRGTGVEDTGAAFLWKRVEVNWYEVEIFTAFDAEEGDQYGISVAIEGQTVVVGAAYDNDNGIQSGSAYTHQFGPLTDCNLNGYGDALEILQGIAMDNNENGIPDECDCVGDVNFDGQIDGLDLTLLLSDWGNTGSNIRSDANLDGRVDGADLTILLAGWGLCPEL